MVAPAFRPALAHRRRLTNADLKVGATLASMLRWCTKIRCKVLGRKEQVSGLGALRLEI